MSGYAILAHLVSLVPPKTAGLPLPDGLTTGRAFLMAAIAHINTIPHTRIDNTIIANMADIGVYCYAVYSAIKMHLNQATGACFPSYATIACMTGIHRSTVIACVKKLRSLKLVDPQWRYKEDGSHASNQYHFQAPEKAGASKMQGADNSAPSKKVDGSIQIHGRENSGASYQYNCDKGSRPEPPPLVVENNHPGCPEPPEQVLSSNKKKRTREIHAYAPTEKQKTCPHPPADIAYLTAENLRICHHCWGLLDECLTLITLRSAAPEAPDNRASAECEVRQLADEPETKQPPVGMSLATRETETLAGIPWKGREMSPDGTTTARRKNPLVFLGTLLTGRLKAS